MQRMGHMGYMGRMIFSSPMLLICPITPIFYKPCHNIFPPMPMSTTPPSTSA